MCIENKRSIEEMMTGLKARIILEYPFFANLLMHLPIQITDEIATLATDGRVILVNPRFTGELSQGELAFCLLHEALHVALGHIWRIGDRNKMVWNYATDYVVNIILETECAKKRSSLLEVPSKNGVRIGLFKPKYKHWSAEMVYKDLMKKMEQGNDLLSLVSKRKGLHRKGAGLSREGAGLSGNGAGLPGNDADLPDKEPDLQDSFDSNVIGSHDRWGNLSAKEKRQLEVTWRVRLAAAAEAAKMVGNMPSGIKTQLGKLLKPQKDWKQLLREFIEVENFDYSWNPPDRRFADSDFFLPDFNEKVEKVQDLYFFIDASGSMSDKDINKCASEIQGAIYQFKNHLHGKLAYFDTKVYDYYDIDDIGGDISKARPKGRGGTEFKAVFQSVNRQTDNVAGIIILSDGYCDFPDVSVTKGIPVLWIFTTPDMTAPYGQYTTLE